MKNIIYGVIAAFFITGAHAQIGIPVGATGGGGGSGTVTSVGAGCGTSTGGSPITTTGNVIAAMTVRANTATSDTIVAADCGNLLTEANASPVAAAIAQAGTTGFASGAFFNVCNKGAGAVTITPATSTIGGASTYVLGAGTSGAPICVGIVSDGTNYQVIPSSLPLALGTGVATAAANNLSAAGGLSSTVASGTSALGTSAISSATCATVVTTTATNTATTDVIWWGFNGDPTAVTGYVPLVSGMLTIIAYPTANNVNYKVCNNTNASITPGAITLNWRVIR